MNWPAPWDASEFDTSASKPALGGRIGAQLLGTIQSGKATIFEFPRSNVPNSALYSVNDQHFCLLARIEMNSLYSFGMTYPEETAGVLGANYAARGGSFRFAIQTLARNGKPAQIPAQVVVHAEGPTLHRLLETRLNEQTLHNLGDGRFHLKDLSRGIEISSFTLPRFFHFMSNSHRRRTSVTSLCGRFNTTAQRSWADICRG